MSVSFKVTHASLPLRRGAALAALAVAAAIPATVPAAAQRRPARDTAPPFTPEQREALREASRDARVLARERTAGDSAARRRRADSAAASAFADPEARDILARARAARERQDSALTAYRATATQRISVGLGARRTGLEKLLFRSDNVAQVAWRRGTGAWITPLGSRIVVPMAKGAQGDIVDAVPVPYFPGREQLWFPNSGMRTVRTDIDERDLIHPIARGAEAWYRYASGDSVGITLGDGRVIRLRELRITARRPESRLFVGSFWFDRDGGQLVRAAYRLAAEIDIWASAEESEQQDQLQAGERARLRDSLVRERLPRSVVERDSVARARAAARGNDEDGPPAWVKAAFRPARAALDGITVEYGLHQGRFWLPRSHSATMWAEAGFMRIPVRFDEAFTYEQVNGDLTLPAVPAARPAATAGEAPDSGTVEVRRGASVSVSAGAGVRDSSGSPRVRGDSLRQRQCATDSTWTRTQSRYGGALRVAYALPCDMATLATSPALPPASTPTEALFDEASRDALLSALDLSLQSEFLPQRPTLRTGADLVRYNRVEGLSVGVLLEQSLGAGYTLSGEGRLGHADRTWNGELALARSNGRRTVRAAAFHRLAAVNPEWAGGLSLGASLPALLYTRDEGFYYRTMGAELADRRPWAGGTAEARLFLERQWTAGDTGVLNTFSLPRLFGEERRFRANINAERVAVTGVAGSWQRAFARDPAMGRITTALRGEAGTGTFQYARAAVEATATRRVGPVAASLTGAAGSSTGRVPFQRLWYVGGVRTVRGQLAGIAGGNAFWLTRAELGTRQGVVRPVVFFDAGWAGSREAIGRSRALQGAGVGAGFLDGLFRIDVAKGVWPRRGWRTDLYLEAPL